MTQIYETAEVAIRGTLADLAKLPASENDADLPAKQQAAREHLNYGFTLSSPLHRLSEGLPLHVAVARFVWMMGANNRLEDIAFYEPKVRPFTDDSLTVPGSSYGMRLRQSQPGLDQVKGVIDRLAADAETRQAALSIYQPIDAVRKSNDIPCAFGLLLNARNGILQATLIMRSNNSATLLPFNLFEFSLLMEVIAVEAKLNLGSLYYFAGSMHLFERDVVRIKGRIAPLAKQLPPMPPMPSTVSPLAELTKLAVFEADLRHASSSIGNGNINDWCQRCIRDFAPYWSQFALLLVSAVAAKQGEAALGKVTARLQNEFKELAPKADLKNQQTVVDGDDLFSKPAPRLEIVQRSQAARHFATHAERYEREKGNIGAARLLRTQEEFLGRLAARGEDDVLTYEAFTRFFE